MDKSAMANTDSLVLMIMEIPELIQHWGGENGGFAFREIPGRGLCCLMRMMFSIDLLLDLRQYSYGGRYSFSSFIDALEALSTWDGIGNPGEDWIRFISSDLEIINKNR